MCLVDPGIGRSRMSAGDGFLVRPLALASRDDGQRRALQCRAGAQLVCGEGLRGQSPWCPPWEDVQFWLGLEIRPALFSRCKIR